MFMYFFLDKNTPPKANAGGDKTVVLPVSAIVLNGSLSRDDLAIVKWEWIREPNSLAAGNIVLNSDHSSVLTVCLMFIYFMSNNLILFLITVNYTY